MKLFKKIIIILSIVVFTLLGTACTPVDNSKLPAAHRDPVSTVTKKGVCVSRYNDGKSSSAQKINELSVSWYYTWGVRTNNEYINAEFVPMVWGRQQANNSEDLDYVKTNYENGIFSHLLTFNEPDLPDQANMTVEEALSYWPALEKIGIPLSSPVVSHYTPGGWLDKFMEGAIERGYRIDFITVHEYQSFYSTGAANSLKTDTLDVLYQKYKLPIWLTEFGAIDIIARDSGAGKISASCTEDNAKKYVEQTTNMLEQCGYIERYSWFLDNFNEKGNARAWEAPYTSLYYDNDTVSVTGTSYKNVTSNVPLYLETKVLEKGKANTEYSQTILTSGGTGDYSFSATGLPAGLSINVAGTISGTPSLSGIYGIKVTVTDSGSPGKRQTRTHNYTLTITN